MTTGQGRYGPSEKMEDRGEVDVSIVMPCLNEAGTLADCVADAEEAIATLRKSYGLSGEIVIADNGSTDGGPQIAERLGARVVHVDKKGYGSALIGGIRAARGRYIAMGDADCSYDFREAAPMIVKLREGYDLCMGSRFRGRILPNAMPWKNRYIGNPVLTGVLNLLFRSRLSDSHCGLRAFTKDAFERMRLAATGMEFASEMLIKASLLDLRRTEVPVTLRPDARGHAPHLRPWRDGWRHLRYLLMLSPGWLFHAPSAILGTIGLAIFSILILNPEAEVVKIGPIWFGDHWMIISGALLAVSHQTAIFGLATTLYGIRERYRKATPLLRRVYRLARLEWMLLAGIFFLLLGGGFLTYIIAEWSAQGFGPLAKVREMVAATTLALIGIQNLFGGFLLSIIGGNVAELDIAIEEASLEALEATEPPTDS